MGLMDTLTKEDRIPVQFSTLYGIMLEATKAQLMESAIKANVPHGYIRGMLTGVEESTIDEGETSEDITQSITKANAALGISVGEYEEKVVEPYDDIEDGDAPLK